jgi:hypothetical protein
MNIRDLKKADKALNNYREFNHLRIENLDYFLSNYKNNLEYYESPFKILADLEDKVKFQNNPEKTILCPYKPDGDAIFQLEKIEIDGNLRIVTYSFETYIS